MSASDSDNPYKSCVDLACRMNSNPEVYKEFTTAMSNGPPAFTAWLTDNGVPANIATAVASQSTPELYETVGEVVCQRFW